MKAQKEFLKSKSLTVFHRMLSGEEGRSENLRLLLSECYIERLSDKRLKLSKLIVFALAKS